MLTKEQKDQLEPFTKHPKFGKLLIDSMKTWEEINPATDEYGVKVDYDKELIVKDCQNGCCLIGASVLDKISF